MQHLVQGSNVVCCLLTMGQCSSKWQAVSKGHVVSQEGPPGSEQHSCSQGTCSPASAQDSIELHLFELYAGLQA